MAYTTFEQVEADTDAIKTLLNQVQIAITNLGSKAQLRQLNLLMQKDIEDLRDRVSDLEAEVALLKSKL